MKTLSVLLAVCCVPFTAHLAQAQLFKPFTAQAPVERVMETASETMAAPELVAIVTADIEFDYDTYVVASEFDFETGEAQSWIYLVQDADNPFVRDRYLVACLAIGGFIVINVEDLVLPMPEDYFDNLQLPLDADWMDSGELVSHLRMHPPVQDYLAAHPGSTVTLAGIWKEFFLGDETMWAVFIGEFRGSFDVPDDEPGLLCQTQAFDGTTECFEQGTPTDAAEGNNADETAVLRVAPNPADEFVSLYVAPMVEREAARIRIADINGSVVMTSNLRGDAVNVPLRVAGLTAGVYTVQILDKQGRVLAHSTMLRR